MALLRWIVLGLCLLAGAATATAQPATSDPGIAAATAALDRAKATLDDAESALQGHSLSEDALQDLHKQVDPVGAQIQTILERLTPRLNAAKTRLDQLGPKPADGVAETPVVASERADQQKVYGTLDEAVKRAKLLAVQADQTSAQIAERERLRFAHSLFERNRSLLSPRFWIDAARETVRDAKAGQAVFVDWLGSLNDQLAGWRRPLFWALVACILTLYWGARRLARRVLSREPTVTEPSRLQQALAAGWTTLVIAVAPIACMLLFLALVIAFNLDGGRLTVVIERLAGMIVAVSVAAGLANGLFAPNHPGWRLWTIDEKAAAPLTWLTITTTFIVSLGHVVESAGSVVGASSTLVVGMRATLCVLVALCILAVGRNVAIDGDVDAADVTHQPIETLARLAAWLLTVVLLVGALAGFVTFGAFLAEQLVWVLAVAAVTYLLMTLIEELIARHLDPRARLGHRLFALLGLRRESLAQIAVLLSGALRVTVFLVAVMLVLLPWGVQSDSWMTTLRGALVGFSIGGITVAPTSIVIAIVIFALGVAATRVIQNWLERSLLPLTTLDAGLRNSIRTSIGYVGNIVALSLALAELGLDFQKLAIVAGALSVGIGFGLQSIFNNFVSGLILLWERAVRVGDWIVVGSDQGFVRRINVRSTEIETFDRAAVIIPNSNLISGVVKNLVRTDRTGRLTIDITVHASANPEAVRDTLLELAKADDAVLSIPMPQVRFSAMTAGSLTFELLCFVPDVETMLRVRSDLHFAIHKSFRAKGYFDGPPPDPLVVDLKGFAQLEALLQRNVAPQDLAPAEPRKSGRGSAGR